MTNNRAIIALLSVVVTLATFTAALSVSSANTALSVSSANSALNVSSARTTPVQSGGPYEIKPSVIAGGGGTSSNGATRLDGTIGQSVLGTSSGGNFSLNGGFWQSQPASVVNIAGTVSYCAASVPPGAPNVTMTLTTGGPGMTTTDAMGNYSFQSANLPAGATYTVTPSKTGAISGITSFDAARVQQQVLSTAVPPLTSCQQLAGDVSQNGSLSSFDAALIQQFVLNVMPVNPSNHTGEWKFNPASRNYVSLVSDQTNQNFDAMLLGDVTGNWTPAGPTQEPPAGASQPNAPTAVTVSLPNASAGVTLTNFSLPMTVNVTTTPVISFDLTFTFNPAVLGLQNPAVSPTALTANYTIGTNTSTPGTLQISGFIGAGGTPIIGSGNLLNINFVRLGAQGTSTNLTWVSALFDEQPASANNGSISIGGAPTAVKLDQCVAKAYDGGVYLEWKTGLEVDNLGFNVYRERGGLREQVTPEIVAGSALLTGETRLQTGRTYGWWDALGKDTAGVQYWLEDIDINGTRTLHGPFAVKEAGGKPPSRSAADVLSQVGRSAAKSASTRFAYHPVSSGDQLQRQQELASGPAVKLTVRDEGWFSLSRQELLLAGLAPGAEPRNLQLFLRGQEVPIAVVGENGNSFDAIEFYGVGQDTVSTNAHVYWLVAGSSAGKRINVVKGGGNAGGAASFGYTVEKRDRTVYFSGLRNGEQENFFGAVVAQQGVDQKLTLRNLDPHAQAAELEVALQGVSELTGVTPDHAVRVAINGISVGRMIFDGREHKSERFSVYQNQLKEGDNTVTLQSEGGQLDVSLVDYVRITFQHAYVAEENVLKFTAGGETLKGSPDGVTQTIGGFTNSSIRVMDVTDAGSPEELRGNVEKSGSVYQVTVNVAGNRARTLLAFTADRIKRPATVAANQPSSLRSSANGADLLLLAREDLSASLQPLVELRQKQGLSVAVVDVENVFDEFNYGERSSQAVKDFISFAATSWKKKPKFALIAGDGTFDPKGYLGKADADIVATKLIDTQLMETASDEWFVDFNNDGIGELAIGRLPMRDSSEAALIVGKIIAYERATPSEEALLVSDANDAFDFESVSNALRGLMPGDLRVSQINRGRLDAGTAKRQLLEALNRGQRLVNYIGHGNVDQWNGDLLTNDDARGLLNGQHLSVFVMMTCLNGYYEDPVLSGLAEELMRAPQGGAVAVWASAGLTTPDQQALMNQEFYRHLFANRGITMGDAIRAAKATVSDPDVRRTWVLLGDPTMRVK